MKRYIFILFAAVAIVVSMASCSSSRVVSAEQATNDSLANLMARRLFEKKQFVLTADRITLGNSPIISVTDNTNFVLVNGDQGVVQLSPRLSGGPNGVGGITASGNVSNYLVNVNKKGETIVSFHLTATIGSADVRIVLGKRGKGATAYIDATFHRGRASLMGEIAPLPSNIITGQHP